MEQHEKPNFGKVEIETPTYEQANSEEKTKYNRFAFEWYMENTVKTYFNRSQETAERAYKALCRQMRTTAILAGTSMAVAAVALTIAVILACR